MITLKKINEIVERKDYAALKQLVDSYDSNSIDDLLRKTKVYARDNGDDPNAYIFINYSFNKLLDYYSDYRDMEILKYCKLQYLDMSKIGTFYIEEIEEKIVVYHFFKKTIRVKYFMLDTWGNSIKYELAKPYIDNALSIQRQMKRDAELLQLSIKRVEELKSINSKYNDSELNEILSITTDINEIFSNRKMSTHKLEQFHTYYTDSFLDVLRDYTNKIDSDVNPKLKDLIRLENKKEKGLKYIEYTQKSLFDSLYNEMAVKVVADKSKLPDTNLSASYFTDNLLISDDFLEANGLLLDLENSIMVSPKFVSRKILKKVIYSLDLTIVDVSMSNEYRIVFKSKGRYWEICDYPGEEYKLVLRETVFAEVEYNGVVDFKSRFISNMDNEIEKMRSDIYSLKETSIQDIMEEYKMRINKFLDDKRKITVDERLLGNLKTAMELEMSDF